MFLISGIMPAKLVTYNTQNYANTLGSGLVKGKLSKVGLEGLVQTKMNCNQANPI